MVQDSGARVLAIYGGSDIQRQIRSLKRGPHIIVGTPGRLLDHIKRRTLKLDRVQTLVLDEADEMLNMGFIEDIEAILSTVPAERQTLLFSATMPQAIRRIATRFMKDPEIVRIEAKEMTVSLIEQFFVKVPERDKFDVLSRLIDVHSPELAIIFGRTKRRVDELANALTLRGYTAEGIHGDLSQAKRLSVLKKFKEGKVEILVATDVAARGLDISGVTHVYNYDIPQDPESYVHRIGRTGRAGKEGMAITFVSPREMGYLRIVEQTTKKRMQPMVPPTVNEALESQQRVTMEKLDDTLREGKLEEYMSVAKELLAEHDDAVTVIAAALKELTKEPDKTPVHISAERPLPSRENRSQGRSSGGGGGGGGGNRNNRRGKPSSQSSYKGNRKPQSRRTGGNRP